MLVRPPWRVAEQRRLMSELTCRVAHGNDGAALAEDQTNELLERREPIKGNMRSYRLGGFGEITL
jgi:hypothetical protein